MCLRAGRTLKYQIAIFPLKMQRSYALFLASNLGVAKRAKGTKVVSGADGVGRRNERDGDVHVASGDNMERCTIQRV